MMLAAIWTRSRGGFLAVAATLTVWLFPLLVAANPEGSHGGDAASHAAEGGEHGAHAAHEGIRWWGFPSEEDSRVGFLIIIINFIVLLLVLNKLLFKGLVKKNREKSDAIKGELEKATTARTEAEGVIAEYKSKVEALEGEVEKIRAEARAASERERESVLAEAREQAQTIIKNSELQAERDSVRRRNELENEIVDQAMANAEQVIRKGFGDADQRRLLDKYVEEVSAVRFDKAGGA
jgi:F-type H+-transporting ATPase subunit b